MISQIGGQRHTHIEPTMQLQESKEQQENKNSSHK